jgi:hypothetical protein
MIEMCEPGYRRSCRSIKATLYCVEGVYFLLEKQVAFSSLPLSQLDYFGFKERHLPVISNIIPLFLNMCNIADMWEDVGDEDFTAVAMNHAVFWDIRIHLLPHRKHYVSATKTSQLMPCKI